MAKEQDVQDVVMDIGRLKGILKVAISGDDEDGGKKSRIPIVVALDNDGEGIISAAKKGKPKKLRTEAIKDITKAKLTNKITADNAHLYFGYAFTDSDTTILRIELNKKPQGEGKLATALLRRVRPAGFSSVVFGVNDKLEAEPEEDGISTPTPGTAAPAYDAAQLQKMLAALTGRIPAAAGQDAARLEALNKLAALIGTNISANAALATSLLRKLSEALGPAPSQSASNASVYMKFSQDWSFAHQRMTSDLAKLRAELVATYQEQGVAGDVEKRYDDVVKPLLTKIDAGLADKLTAVAAASDPAVQASLVEDIKVLIARYNTALTDPIVGELDTNPFVTLTIKDTLASTLTSISAAIH